MFKKIILIVCFFVTGLVFAHEPILRDYDEITIPAGSFVPIMSMQEFSTAYTQESEPLTFVTTNDIFMFNSIVLPKGAKITGYIEKKNEPVVGTNAAMKVFLNKMYLPDGFEMPIKGYINTANDNKIGGELTEPLTYNKVPHYQRWSMFKAFGVSQYVPGDQRRMGEHVTISSGANLIMVLVEPIYITHNALIN